MAAKTHRISYTRAHSECSCEHTCLQERARQYVHKQLARAMSSTSSKHTAALLSITTACGGVQLPRLSGDESSPPSRGGLITAQLSCCTISLEHVEPTTNRRLCFSQASRIWVSFLPHHDHTSLSTWGLQFQAATIQFAEETYLVCIASTHLAHIQRLCGQDLSG